MDRRNTIQRQLVFDVVCKLNHPDADEVYAAISKEHPHISKATVYRNLNLLAEQNIIQKIETGCGADKFDYRAPAHPHLRCRRCGKLVDAQFPALDLAKAIEQNADFAVERYNLEFIGLCSECKNILNKEQEDLQK